MKFLGIDYGTKRIGVATSDEEGVLTFPRVVLPNDERTLDELGKIIKKENISEIIVGESVDFSGEPNPVASQASTFTKALEQSFGIPVHKQKEFLTSAEARRYRNPSKQAKHPQAPAPIDAAAAALILQRYLDRRANSKTRRDIV